jgi:hypothetical protein
MGRADTKDVRVFALRIIVFELRSDKYLLLYIGTRNRTAIHTQKRVVWTPHKSCPQHTTLFLT